MVKDEYKKALSATVIKLEKEGDSIEGVYKGYEESRQFDKSYALKIKQGEELKTVFVSGIVIDMLETNSIKKDTVIKVVYTGLKQSETNQNRKYKTYELFYK